MTFELIIFNFRFLSMANNKEYAKFVRRRSVPLLVMTVIAPVRSSAALHEGGSRPDGRRGRGPEDQGRVLRKRPVQLQAAQEQPRDS